MAYKEHRELMVYGANGRNYQAIPPIRRKETGLWILALILALPSMSSARAILIIRADMIWGRKRIINVSSRGIGCNS
ncbi:MAG: hypothetical protein PUB52_01945 [Lachnospiraceae bacterium]|nr:hypothetical protein [Lachnospiraceae bacterium]